VRASISWAVMRMPVAGADRGAFDDGVDVELAGNIGEWAAGALVGHDRSTGDDAKVGDPGKLCDEFVGHAVGEVLLRRVTGEVVKGENGEGTHGRELVTTGKEPDGGDRG